MTKIPEENIKIYDLELCINPINPFKRLRQEDDHEFEARLSYIMSYRLALATM